ncbi:hypothetical protein HS1genome_2221 [Sulfodiicoccus acidiphilus]|uniref:Uncharacterized protein n=1 Tax=Sulfodiicoccus acidiphilus TaxID=1670455 RepID=A0A348B6N0_9CREN|nr:hypothetical protein HS1genome_2221 [Sulfodiicoccus acidiphilus]
MDASTIPLAIAALTKPERITETADQYFESHHIYTGREQALKHGGNHGPPRDVVLSAQ